ncbi:MAG: type II toxin-antitoxin system Phd/YefM family antitoxin [Ignavibacteriota bacterium]|nr:MAG: type II toxin-antitoxin system Phd/YefM family antitoxin [Chlorobiota bacterium]MBE7476315.1 type II toxin-antitoxin system Phd/YefM family antitoxin [Ignavibacteriales bacterium]MBL1124203.1 type II toxin-antitoxin system Phd/YefM family antitoxin [Ignavibacteriota bacterium]MCC7093656.1 type II toxin-antitoxin system Phd/YefM family antitoxin [Ignavibacteriaceae bacterium]MCE7857577.1 type II toxin-antitoxin system Phd/YefM family antitoxin [Ignavibacteria bacterium CHB3]MEB2297985.1
MRLSESVKSISYLKANAANMIEEINQNQKTYVITQNGEAKVIVQDIKVFEQTQEALALLKILAMSGKNLKNKRYKPMDKTFKDIRKKISKFKKETK